MRRLLQKTANFTGVAMLVIATLVGVLAMAAPATPLADRVGADSSEARPDSTPQGVVARMLGLSGRLRVVDVAPLAALVPAIAAGGPGMHPTGLSAPDGEPIQALALVPLNDKLGATWHGYRVGYWPGERAANRHRSRYPLPGGFLEVTPENQDLPLTTHFRVRDFLTHDQQDTWPKVLVIQLPLLDKLELIQEALEGLGKPAALRVMSGFRTPQYNALGVGPRGGRARDSRHMYGDAADIFVDADGDGRMDDLDGDGRVTVKDAQWLARVAAGVDAQHPAVTGGIGIYRANAAHGPFVHVDTRGTPARW
jgi:Peptidase M15